MDVERELRAALDVDPSPEFVARVRMRIASEPAPRRWGFAWMAVAVGAAAAIVIAVVATRSIGERKENGSLLASRALSTAAAPIDPAGPDQFLPRLRRSAGASAKAEGLRDDDHAAAALVAQANVAQPSRTAVAQPEILVDPREAAAIRRLIAGVSLGEIDLRPMLARGPVQAAEPAPIVDILIEPIAIEPLPVGSEGARP